MKKMMFTLLAMLTIAVTANAMSYEQARNEALFLTDKMAYELNLTDAQYEAAYEINLDYLMGVTSQYDVFGPYWERRNLDLSYILFSWQWDLFRAATYFYRPLYWNAGYWHFGVYARYPHRDYFYFGRPHFYASYRGGHSWRMNGGRSFYEGRRDFYRPNGHSRDNHFGMRNGWDRGDYRGGRVSGGSSTRHTEGGNNGGFHNNGGHNNGGHNGSFGNNGGRNNGGHNGSFGNSNNSRNGGSFGNSNNSHNGGSFGNNGGNSNGGRTYGNPYNGNGSSNGTPSLGNTRQSVNQGVRVRSNEAMPRSTTPRAAERTTTLPTQRATAPSTTGTTRGTNSGSFGTTRGNGGSFSGGSHSSHSGSFGGSTRGNSGGGRSHGGSRR